MSIWSKIFTPAISSAAKPIGESIQTIGEAVGDLLIDIRTAITGVNPEQKAKLEETLTKLAHASMTAQIELNKIEAQSSSIWVAGWRPAVGWVCAIGLAWQYIVQPLLNWTLYSYASFTGIQVIPAPELQIADLLTLLAGMLGFGYLRTKEKTMGVQGKH